MGIKGKIAELINVKTLVTLTMLGVFAYLSVVQAVTPKEFLEIFKLVIIFYFGAQSMKNIKEDKNVQDKK